jgi:hypothetical protein
MCLPGINLYHFAKAKGEIAMSTGETIDANFTDEDGTSPVGDGGMLALVSKAEIDMQIATAKKYPRDIKKFRNESMSLACLDAEVAGECFYRRAAGQENWKSEDHRRPVGSTG